MAGLIGTATSSKDGLQLKDVAFKSLTRTVYGNSELNLGYVNGLVFIRNRSSTYRYLLFFCSKGTVTPIVNVDTIPQALTYNSDGELVFTNGSSSNRSVTIYWMELPDIS